MKQLFRLFLLMVGFMLFPLAAYSDSYCRVDLIFKDFNNFEKTCKLSRVSYSVTFDPQEGFVPLEELSNTLCIDNYYTDASGNKYLITGIDQRAFTYCPFLKELQLPSSVKTIGENLFAYTPTLEKVSFTDGGSENFEVSKDGKELYFLNKSDSEVVKTLVWVARDKKTDNFILSKDIDVQTLAFNECKDIQKVTVEEGNPYIVEENGVLMNAAKTWLLYLPPAADYIKLYAGLTVHAGLVNCGDNLTVDIPWDNVKIKTGEYSMLSEAAALILAEGVRILEPEAFKGWSRITKVKVPKSLNKCGENVFYGCYALKEINYADFSNEIGQNLLCGTGIETVTMPDSWSVLKLMGCPSLKELTLKSGRTETLQIDCPGLEKLNYPSSDSYVEEIKRFATCPYLQSEDFELREGLKKIGTITVIESERSRVVGAFEGSIMYDLILPESLETLYQQAFKGAVAINLKQLKLSESISIGTSAFENLNSDATGAEYAIELVIPQGLEIMEDHAFQGAHLKTIIFEPDYFTERYFYERYFVDHWDGYLPEYIPTCYAYCGSTTTRLDLRGEWLDRYSAEYWCTYWKGLDLNQILIYSSVVPDVEISGEYPKWAEYCDQATLYVPENLVYEYKSHPFWKWFKRIEVLTPNVGVEDVTAEDIKVVQGVNGALVATDPTLPVEVYTLDGICRHTGCLTSPLALPSGIYIVRVGNESLKVKL